MQRAEPHEGIVHRHMGHGDTDEEEFLRLTGLIPLAMASRQIGATPETLRRHLAVGDCSGRKIDGRWFVHHQAVDRWKQRHPRSTAPRGGSPDRGPEREADTCPCSAGSPHLGHRAAAELAVRAQHAHILDRLREHEHQLAMDVLGMSESVDLPPGCRAWVDGAVDAAAHHAAQAALDALLDALARHLSGAPSDVLARLDRGGLRYVVELA